MIEKKNILHIINPFIAERYENEWHKTKLYFSRLGKSFYYHS